MPVNSGGSVCPFCLRPRRGRLRGIVNTAFAQRRKQLGKVLGAAYGREAALAALENAGIAPETRPDKLGCEAFFQLAKGLFPAIF